MHLSDPDPEPSTELWYVVIELDLNTLLQNKKTNTYFPARLSFKTPNGEVVKWDIKVRVRGRFRRMTCEFPPLKVKMPKKKVKELGFGKNNTVKLVTHCEENKKAKEYLFREYLIYQLYGQLTDVKFETQLLQITYRDTGSGDEMITYGVFIEDVKSLADRLNAKECKECFGLTHAEFDRSNLQIHDLFQYMIGNADWSIIMNRNLKILTPKEEAAPKMVVPYDFDFSGLVNAAYAIPNADFKQKNVRERFYLGANWPEAEWSETIAHFKKKREELYDTIEQFEFINKKAKKDIKKYLDSFYKELDKGFVPRRIAVDQ
ncbi:MAG: hypothetical protein DHS20C18_38050 [Saprospiraceae bacterium]|nr:MAG: hypothetical protein DHS20C18_38050 [Saprospiraceae bacterium]